MRLAGSRCVVTGAASGVGRAVAERFAAEGAAVVVADVNEEGASEVAGGIRDAGGQGLAVAVDVRDPGSVDAMVAASVTHHGGLDVIVNSAAIARLEKMIDISLESWNQVLSVNLTGVFLCAQAAARHMRGHGGGRIINISSVNGQQAITGRGAYTVAKGGLEMMTRLMASELGVDGITVNNVAPAPVDTPMILELHTESTRAEWHRCLPIKRYARPDEVAAACLYLASDEAGYVTGHTLNVDGGFVAAGMLLDL